MQQIVVYPGSFDPVTNGHLDIIKRASQIFGKVIVAVFKNSQKQPLFTMEERVDLLKKTTKDFENVFIDSFTGLTIDYVKSQNAIAIIRGLRAISDFEGEFQMASLNKELNVNVETIFFMTDTRYAYLSSSVVKEVAQFGGNIEGLVPEIIKKSLENKYSQGNSE